MTMHPDTFTELRPQWRLDAEQEARARDYLRRNTDAVTAMRAKRFRTLGIIALGVLPALMMGAWLAHADPIGRAAHDAQAGAYCGKC